MKTLDQIAEHTAAIINTEILPEMVKVSKQKPSKARDQHKDLLYDIMCRRIFDALEEACQPEEPEKVNYGHIKTKSRWVTKLKRIGRHLIHFGGLYAAGMFIYGLFFWFLPWQSQHPAAWAAATHCFALLFLWVGYGMEKLSS